MTRNSKFRELIEPLLGQLPGSTIEDLQARDWYSATFEGQKLTFAINLACDFPPERVGHFMDNIGESDWPVGEFFVADIAATAVRHDRIEIEILLIKE